MPQKTMDDAVEIGVIVLQCADGTGKHAMHDANAKTNNSNSDNSLNTYEKQGRAHVRGTRQTAGTRATWSMEYKSFSSSCSHSNMNNRTLSSP